MSEHNETHEEHGTTLAHPDDAKHNVVAILIGLLAIVVAITAYSLWAFFVREAESINHKVVLSLENPQLKELRAKEEAELAGAPIADEAVRLPIEEAAALFVKEAQARKQAGIPQRIQAVAEVAAEETETP